MKIISDIKGDKYIDQTLFDYIKNIWLNYDIEIDKDSCIYFSKNTTVNRLITDYCGKNISRVIKKEKADYVIIKKIYINNYPKYYDITTQTISNDDTKEVVYGIYNNSCEDSDTIELILDFIIRKQEVKYVNQDKLNESLNNGFVIDKESYTTIKELVDSSFSDNHQLAMNMLINSNLKENWKWILYLYYKKDSQFSFDKKNIISNYFSTLNTGKTLFNVLNNIDDCLLLVKDNVDVCNRFIYLIRDKFEKNIINYFKSTLGTNKFILDDFKIRYVD